MNVVRFRVGLVVSVSGDGGHGGYFSPFLHLIIGS